MMQKSNNIVKKSKLPVHLIFPMCIYVFNRAFTISNNHYSELKMSYVIFICTEDLFGENLSVYHFQNLCVEKVDEKLCLKLNDGTCTIFLNAACTDESVSDELKALF